MMIKVVMMVMIFPSENSDSTGAVGVLWINYERKRVTLSLETVIYEYSLYRFRPGFKSN